VRGRRGRRGKFLDKVFVRERRLLLLAPLPLALLALPLLEEVVGLEAVVECAELGLGELRDAVRARRGCAAARISCLHIGLLAVVRHLPVAAHCGEHPKQYSLYCTLGSAQRQRALSLPVALFPSYLSPSCPSPYSSPGPAC
jgi:hypothetical protein